MMKLRKIINVITLVVMVSVNVITPISYADTETGDFVGAETPVVVEEPVAGIPAENNDDTPTSGNILDVENLKGFENIEYSGDFVDYSGESLKFDGQYSDAEILDDGMNAVNVGESYENNSENNKNIGLNDFVIDKSFGDEKLILSETSATLLPGEEFNIKIKNIVGITNVYNTSSEDNYITKIQRGTATSAVQTVDNKISINDSEPVYAWFDNGILYFDTNADKIYFNSDSRYMFYKLKSLTEINLKIFDLSRVEQTVAMFQEADSLVELDFSGMNLNSMTSIYAIASYSDNLEKIDFTNAEMNNLSEILYTAQGCPKFTTIIFNGTKLHNLTSINNSIGTSNNLKIINFSGAEMDNLTSIRLSDISTLEEVNFSYAKMPILTSLSNVFGYDTKLKKISFDHAQLNNLSNMSSMFKGCSVLEDVNLNGNWGNAVDMSYMFKECTNLKNVNSINTSGVINMSFMFNNCTSLENIDLSNWDTSKVTDMSYMFKGCTSLENIDLSNWNTSSVTNMYGLFYECSNLEYVNFGNIDTRGVTNMAQMFNGCSKLENIDMSNLDISMVTTMQGMFYGCNNLRGINLNTKNTSSLQNMSWMFSHCDKLENLDLSNRDTSRVTTMEGMFYENSGLTGMDLTNLDASSLQDMSDMFYGCSKLEKVNLDNLSGSKITDISSMFYNCSNLKEVNFSNANLSNVTSMYSLFRSCLALEKVNFSNANLSKLSDYSLFNYDSFREIDFSNANLSNLTYLDSWFANSKNLKSVNFEGADLSKVTSMGYMFQNCDNLENVKFSDSLNKVEYMWQIFEGCTSLKELDLSPLDTSNVTSMNSIFKGANKLKTIWVSDKFVINDGMYSGDMFKGATSIVGGKGTTYDENHIDGLYARIDNAPDNPGYFTNILDKPYNITYNLDGGEIVGKKTTYTQRDTFTLPVPTRQGYTFKGWIGSNGNNPQIEVTINAGTKGDLEYTAIWEVKESGNNSSGGGKKTVPTTKEVTETTDNEHNSADEKENTNTSEVDKTPLNEETKKEVVSVTKEVSDDGTEVEVVVETVAIKNTNIIATVRTETPVNGNNSNIYSSATHTKEQADAYSFAKSNGITTTESIETAKMNTELTRIQMAKMLSNFAINVLGQEPDTEKGTVEFKDVTTDMDKEYDNAVTKSYQLGIMGQNVKDNKFRPNDGVSRAEFSTALSRLLYNTEEGKYKGTNKYYIPHIVKLYNEGIVNKAEPGIKEKRGYVMTMLMRTVK